MPYSSVDELPQAVKDKIKSPKKRRQWMHVWNSEYDRHHDESRAFASAWSVVQKFHAGVTEMDDKLNFFLPICKIDKQARTVSGYASTNCIDSDGEIVTQEAIKAALPDYMKYGNIREMHKLWAVGVANEASLDDRGLYLTAKIVDNAAWDKAVEGVYKGFSIGGRKLTKVGNRITKLAMNEISIVDRPSNPDCMFTVAKMQGGELVEDDAFLVKVSDGNDSEPDADADDEKVQQTKKAKKKAKKLAKAQASKLAESALPPTVGPHAEGRVEAALDGGQSRHELTLKKTDGSTDRSLRREPVLSLRGSGTDSNLLLKSKKRGKDKAMSADTKSGNSAVGMAILKAMGYKPETATHPALPLIKAADGNLKSIRDLRKAAVSDIEKLFEMHKSELAKAAVASATPIDNTQAMRLIKSVFDNLEAMKVSNRSARDGLRKAAGRISGSGTVEDGLGGVYDVPTGLRTVSPDELDNAPVAKGDFVTKEHADVLAKMAALEAENNMLKAQPADPVHGRRPAGFDPNRFGVASDQDSNAIMKGINGNSLTSKDQRVVEKEVGKMIGNMIHTPGVGKTIFDPDFHGTMGGGTA